MRARMTSTHTQGKFKLQPFMRARVTSTHTEQVSINVLRGDESLLCEEGVPCFARRMCLAMRAGVCLAEECVF